MNPADVAPVARNARRQLDQGLTACILQADQVAALTAAYADAVTRLARIAAIVERTWTPFCDNDRDAVREALEKIEKLARLGIDTAT